MDLLFTLFHKDALWGGEGSTQLSSILFFIPTGLMGTTTNWHQPFYCLFFIWAPAPLLERRVKGASAHLMFSHSHSHSSPCNPAGGQGLFARLYFLILVEWRMSVPRMGMPGAEGMDSCMAVRACVLSYWRYPLFPCVGITTGSAHQSLCLPFMLPFSISL
jgi:hypothetical protein